MWTFDVFLNVSLKQLLYKQLSSQWFEIPWYPCYLIETMLCTYCYVNISLHLSCTNPSTSYHLWYHTDTTSQRVTLNYIHSYYCRPSIELPQGMVIMAYKVACTMQLPNAPYISCDAIISQAAIIICCQYLSTHLSPAATGSRWEATYATQALLRRGSYIMISNKMCA